MKWSWHLSVFLGCPTNKYFQSLTENAGIDWLLISWIKLYSKLLTSFLHKCAILSILHFTFIYTIYIVVIAPRWSEMWYYHIKYREDPCFYTVIICTWELCAPSLPVKRSMSLTGRYLPAALYEMSYELACGKENCNQMVI